MIGIGKFDILIIFSVLVSGQVLAGSLADRPIKVAYDESPVVAKVTLLGISGECLDENRCLGYLLRLRIDGVLKSDPAGIDEKELLNVCSPVPLDIGGRYTFFMDRRRREDPMMKMEGCEWGVELDGIFQKRGERTYRVRSPDSSIVFTLEGRSFTTDGVNEVGFDEIADP